MSWTRDYGPAFRRYAATSNLRCSERRFTVESDAEHVGVVGPSGLTNSGNILQIYRAQQQSGIDHGFGSGTSAIMSLDGYIAKQDNSICCLFDWLQNGDVAFPTPAGDFTVHLTPTSAEHWKRWTSSLGAVVCGPFTFVTDGVEAAITRVQEIAGDRVVSVSGGTIARQAPDLGLLDEVAIDLVPVRFAATVGSPQRCVPLRSAVILEMVICGPGRHPAPTGPDSQCRGTGPTAQQSSV